jgi:hypothetical protein
MIPSSTTHTITMFRPPALLLLLFSCLLCVFELCSWSLRCNRQTKSFQCAVGTANHLATKPKETERERRESKSPPPGPPPQKPKIENEKNYAPTHPKTQNWKQKNTTYPPKSPKIEDKKQPPKIK